MNVKNSVNGTVSSHSNLHYVAQLVEHKTGDQRFASLSLTAGGVSVLCP